MSSYANFVIVENKQFSIRYSTIQGEFCHRIFAQGLEFCEEFFQAYPLSEVQVITDVLEGGILLDKDNKKALVFGGHDDLDFSPTLQRFYIKHVKQFWPGWDVKWCYRGCEDLSEYLGLNTQSLNEANDDLEEGYYLSIPWYQESPSIDNLFHYVTIIHNGVITDYNIQVSIGGIEKCVQHGESLKDVIPPQLKVEKWQLSIDSEDSLLVDYDHKKLFVSWEMPTKSATDRKVGNYWPGWEVIRNLDGTVFHFDYTNRDRSIIEITDEEFMRDFGNSFFKNPKL